MMVDLMSMDAGTAGNNQRDYVRNLSKEDLDRAIDEAFWWAVREMCSYEVHVQDSIRLLEPEGYRESEDATVAFYYDRRTGIALMRRNWKSGELRYDEVVNYDALRVEDRGFVDHMLENGIVLSRYYIEYGIQP